MSDTDLNVLICPRCLHMGLWARTHGHGSVNHIIKDIKCPRLSCGWNSGVICEKCLTSTSERPL